MRRKVLLCLCAFIAATLAISSMEQRGSSERPADIQLQNRVRVELSIGQVTIDRNFHFCLHVDAPANHHAHAWREIQPVSAADQHRCSVEDVLLTMQPIEAAVSQQAMRADRTRPSRAQFR